MDFPRYSGDGPEYSENLRKWLYSKQTEFLRHAPESLYPPITKLVEYASGDPPEDCSECDWHHVQCLIYLFLCAIWPCENLIPRLCFTTKSGYVFHGVSHLASLAGKMCRDDEDTMADCFREVLSIVLKPHSGNQKFGDIGPAFFMHNVPKLIVDKCGHELACALFNKLIEDFVENNEKEYTDCELSFISIVLRHVTSNTRPEKSFGTRPELLERFFCKIFSDPKIPGMTKMMYFFPWNIKHFLSRTGPGGREYLKYACDVCENLAGAKMCDMPPSFHADVLFPFYEDKSHDVHGRSKIMHFLYRIGSNVQRGDGLQRIDRLIPKFVGVFKAQWSEGKTFSMYHHLSNVVSILGGFVSKMKRVRGVTLKSMRHLYVSFAEQVKGRMESYPIDKDLMTRFNCRCFDTLPEAEAFFDDQCGKIDPVIKKLHLICNLTMIQPLSFFADMGDRRSQYSPLASYWKRIVSAWVHLLMAYSYCRAMFQHFASNTNHAPTWTRFATWIFRDNEPPPFFAKFTDYLLSLPDELSGLVSNVIVRSVEKGLKAQMLTHQFVVVFLWKIMWKASYAKKIIWKMMCKTIDNVELFASRSWNDSFFAQQWILVLLRISATPDRQRNAYLGDQLGLAQKQLFRQCLTNIRHYPAQKLVISAIDWYRRERNFHDKFASDPKARLQLRLRRSVFDDIHPFARKLAIPTYTDSTITDVSSSSIGQFLTVALQSGNAELARTAVDHFLDLTVQNPLPKALDPDIEAYAPLSRSFFERMKIDTTENALTIARAVPSRVHMFMKQSKALKHDRSHLH